MISNLNAALSGSFTILVGYGKRRELPRSLREERVRRTAILIIIKVIVILRVK